MDTSTATFGSRLKAARTKAHMTQGDLISALSEKGFDVKQAALSHYEKGRRFPDPDLMAAMAEAVGVSLDFLSGLTKTSSPVVEIEEALAAASGAGRINKIMDRLPKDKQEWIIAFAEFLLSRERKSKNTDEFEGWVAATEVLMRRHGANGEESFTAFLAAERPDLAAALGIPTKKKSVQDR